MDFVLIIINSAYGTIPMVSSVVLIVQPKSWTFYWTLNNKRVISTPFFFIEEVMSPWPTHGDVYFGGAISKIRPNSRNLFFLEANMYLKA